MSLVKNFARNSERNFSRDS